MKPNWPLTTWLAAASLSLGMALGVAAPITGYRSDDGSHVAIYAGPLAIEHDDRYGAWHLDMWLCVDGFDQWGCPA